METLTAGTLSRTARVSVARRDLKDAEGKLAARGARTAYEASRGRTRGRIDPKARCYPERLGVYAAAIWEEGRASYPEGSADLLFG